MDSGEEMDHSSLVSEDYALIPLPVKKPLKKRLNRLHVQDAWTKEDIFKLINEIEMFPCIWKYHSQDYGCRQKRDIAWKRIQEKINVHSTDECKAKWGNIKTSYNNIKNKYDQGAIKNPRWLFWSAMESIYNHHKGKTSGTESNLSNDDTQTSSLNKNSNTSTNKSPDDLLVSAIKMLEQKGDKWTVFGQYMAMQMRDISAKDEQTANELHAEIIKRTMDVLLAVNKTKYSGITRRR